MKPVMIYISKHYREQLRSFMRICAGLSLLLLLFPMAGQAADDDFLNDYLKDSDLWQLLVDNSDEWFSSEEAQTLASHVLAYQNKNGGWPKNIDFTIAENESRPSKKNLRSTIDNGATYTQLFFLARMYSQTGLPEYRKAFLTGFDYLIDAQYKNGGWPQYYPLRKGYYTHITYNDDAMVGVLKLMHDVSQGMVTYTFMDADRQQQARLALTAGITCILKTQVRRNGQLTVWCAQHDEKTLAPAPARRYELVSLSGKESVGILLFLMSIEKPDQDIQSAVHAGIRWLESVQLHGFRIDHRTDPGSEKGWDKVVVPDSSAQAIWARFYDIDTDEPFLSDRDGLRYYDLADISAERRNDYGWYGTWPKIALKAYYSSWIKQWPLPTGAGKN